MNTIKLLRVGRKHSNVFRIGFFCEGKCKEFLGFTNKDRGILKIKSGDRILELMKNGAQLSESLKKTILQTNDLELIKSLGLN